MTAINALRVAAGELGYSRWNDPLAGSKYGRDYATRHGAAFGVSGVPYCAMFVTWVLRAAGVEYPGGDFAYCPYGINNAVHAGRSVPIRSAQPGDVIFFDWDDDNIADHVGFVEINKGGWVQTIEGNTSPGAHGSQSNGGGVYRRARTWDSVIAVTRPYYGDSAVVEARSTGYQTIPDGWWGKNTTRDFQRYFGTPVDGIVSSQYAPNRGFLETCTSGWEWEGEEAQGSQLIARIQGHIGTTADGFFGMNDVNALEALYGYHPDGFLGGPSKTITAMQRQLNQNGTI